ncbi:MAG: hypothetical protein Q7S72_00610 [Candidatus Taylorbacteria bacterium]|nr:hypothetical protein [Candidatus Taylorbacteria bacterium]
MDTQQIIKEILKILPEKIKQAIKNTDLASKFDMIAGKHGLHLDQNNTLQTETLLVMIGLEPTKDFVGNLEKNLEVSRNEALSLVDDINKEIFYSIRETLEEIQSVDEETPQPPTPVPPPPIPRPPLSNPAPSIQTPYKNPINATPPPTIVRPTLEQAGRFTIEKPPVGMGGSQYNTNINKENVLKGIEDKETKMIDHLLTTPVNSTQKVEVQKPVVENKPYSTDPYREEL